MIYEKANSRKKRAVSEYNLETIGWSKPIRKLSTNAKLLLQIKWLYLIETDLKRMHLILSGPEFILKFLIRNFHYLIQNKIIVHLDFLQVVSVLLNAYGLF